MLSTPISVLGAWPTVSGRFLDFLCGETHCYSYFRHKQVKKNGHFPHQEVLKVNGGFSKDEVLAAVTKTAQVYVRMLIERGVSVPDNVATHQAPVVAVTL
jgi:hypothetical protein